MRARTADDLAPSHPRSVRGAAIGGADRGHISISGRHTYAVTAGLAAAGGRDRAETAPWLPVALAAKTMLDSATSLKLAREEWAENRALCAHCQVATAVSLVPVALALPEAARGLRRPPGR